MTLSFTVYGVAQPKGSHRAFMRQGMKYPIVTDSNRSARSWSQLVSSAASDALTRLGPDAALLTGGVRLSIAFFLPRPASLPKKVTAHTRAPDLDKLTRCIGDALSSIVYGDDAQITDLMVSKRYSTDGRARCDICVEPATSMPRVEAQGEVLRFTLEDEAL